MRSLLSGYSAAKVQALLNKSLQLSDKYPRIEFNCEQFISIQPALVESENSALLNKILEGCRKGKLRDQEMLYKHFYGYAMGICLRYTGNRDEALEILNDSFLKIFNKLDQYDPSRQFKFWLRRIVVNTAIDYYRKQKNKPLHDELKIAQTEEVDADALDMLSAEEIMKMVQRLPDTYRLTFNLFEIEGYSHEEISKMLDIPVGTSKSNLSRAKKKLRELIKEYFEVKYEKLR